MKIKFLLANLAATLNVCCSNPVIQIPEPSIINPPVYIINVKYKSFVNGYNYVINEERIIDCGSDLPLEGQAWIGKSLNVKNVREYYPSFGESGTVHLNRTITDGGRPRYELINMIQLSLGESVSSLSGNISIQAVNEGISLSNNYGQYVVKQSDFTTKKEAFPYYTTFDGIYFFEYCSTAAIQWGSIRGDKFKGFNVLQYWKNEIGMIKSSVLYSCIKR